jgi:hypothetical protein
MGSYGYYSNKINWFSRQDQYIVRPLDMTNIKKLFVLGPGQNEYYWFTSRTLLEMYWTLNYLLNR